MTFVLASDLPGCSLIHHHFLPHIHLAYHFTIITTSSCVLPVEQAVHYTFMSYLPLNLLFTAPSYLTSWWSGFLLDHHVLPPVYLPVRKTITSYLLFIRLFTRYAFCNSGCSLHNLFKPSVNIISYLLYIWLLLQHDVLPHVYPTVQNTSMSYLLVIRLFNTISCLTS